MDITLTDSLLLAGVLAILMVSFAQRRAVTSTASRMFVKDFKNKDLHHSHDKQLLSLRKRLALLSRMLTSAALGSVFGFAAAICAVFDWKLGTNIGFVIGLAFGILSTLLAARESAISNKSHFMEIDPSVSSGDPYYKTTGP